MQLHLRRGVRARIAEEVHLAVVHKIRKVVRYVEQPEDRFQRRDVFGRPAWRIARLVDVRFHRFGDRLQEAIAVVLVLLRRPDLQVGLVLGVEKLLRGRVVEEVEDVLAVGGNERPDAEHVVAVGLEHQVHRDDRVVVEGGHQVHGVAADRARLGEVPHELLLLAAVGDPRFRQSNLARAQAVQRVGHDLRLSLQRVVVRHVVAQRQTREVVPLVRRCGLYRLAAEGRVLAAGLMRTAQRVSRF
mmetsp:Transcript_4655/g.11403  ORF Transcript_4655/g.11403 Transcript_4655/m.11403 type:complete len:244 (-) Transcript_4655:4768-5499(-)